MYNFISLINPLYVFFGIAIIAGLIQWHFDRKWKRNLKSNYETILSYIKTLHSPAGKIRLEQLRYTVRIADNGQVVEKNYRANTAEELEYLIREQQELKKKNFEIDVVPILSNEIYGDGWGDLESDK